MIKNFIFKIKNFLIREKIFLTENVFDLPGCPSDALCAICDKQGNAFWSNSLCLSPYVNSGEWVAYYPHTRQDEILKKIPGRFKTEKSWDTTMIFRKK